MTNVLVKDKNQIMKNNIINLDKYIEIIPDRRSILIDEVKNKILRKPGKLSQKSVFFKLS